MPTLSFARLPRLCLIVAVSVLPTALLKADAVKLQVDDRATGNQIAAQGGRLVADYGTFQLFEVERSVATGLNQAQVQDRDEYNFIQLNAGALDTRATSVRSLRKIAGEFTGKQLHLVQFAGPVQPEWRDELVAAGVQIVAYIPNNAYLVYGDSKSIGQMQSASASASHVQWEGAYADEYKIHPAARLFDKQGLPRVIGTDSFAIQLVADASANASTLQLLDLLKLDSAKRQRAALNYLNIVVRLSPENLAQIAAQPDVVSIQPYYPRRKFCERQDQIIAGNLSGNTPTGPGYMAWLTSKGFTQAQFTSSGFAADVTDSGVDDGTIVPHHPGLFTLGSTANPSRVIYNRLEGFPNNPGSSLVGCDGHGTLNSHVIGGYDDFAPGFPHTDASGYHYGLGVCPFVRLGSSVIFDPDFFTFPDYTGLQSRAYNNGARVSNNSWGADNAGDYDIDAQEYDALVRDAQPTGAPFTAAGNQQMVIAFAAGNAGDDGAQSVGSPGSAKNVFTVGAAENVQAFGGSDGCGTTDTEANSANDIVSFSSRGPCADGRRKPDIVAPGTHISGGVAQALNPGPTGTADSCFDATGVCALPAGNFFPTGQQLFTVSSGTSHSTPAVVGGCALLRQYFINNAITPPSAAMTKAFLMNSSRYMTGIRANDNLWSNTQGMGEMNLGTAFDGAPRLMRDELAADLFTASGQTRVFTGKIANTNQPFRVTLAWTDAPGNTTGNAYNNNLDLTVTIGANVFKGNVFTKSNSVTGGSADTRNNVESVFLPAGSGEDFTVTVTAANINSDGVPNNATPLDQDFALVIYNFVLPPPSVTSLTPTNLTVLSGQPAVFTATAAGQAPLKYQWRFNSLPIPGATSNVFTILAAQLTNSGNYSVVVTNTTGAGTSSVAVLTVIPTVPLQFALNNSLTWTSTPPVSPWYGQTNISHDGVASAQTFLLADSQQAVLKTTVAGPGTLTFWWKVSSQTNADILSFGYGGSNLVQISGEAGWLAVTNYVPAGSQDLTWTYSKNASLVNGQDAAWVDEVTYTPGPTLPFIITQPIDQITIGGSAATFSVLASGTPALAYSWLLNNTAIPGANSASLTISNPITADAGTYSVLVSNAYGSIVSSNAALGVIPLTVRGDDSFHQLDPVIGATNTIAIAAGSWHTLLLKADGRVIAMGNNSDGECTIPPGLSNVVAIAAGGYHSLALRSDQTLATWGSDFYGQATKPPGLSNVIAIAAGTWHSLALRNNRTVLPWGDDSWGQLSVPPGLTNVVAIAAGGNHSLALRANGKVVAWGENTDAQGSFVGQSIVPPGLSNVIAIGAGEYHSLAVKADGSLVIWGDNSHGQSDLPPDLNGVVAATGGGGHTLALKSDGTVSAWGDNSSGQCAIPATQSNIVLLAAGNAQSLLLVSDTPAAPQVLRPTRTPQRFTALLQTFAGRRYALEYKTAFTTPGWTPIATNFGNGVMQFLIDPAATSAQRFYRVRQW